MWHYSLLLAITALLPYAFVERKWRWRWREVEIGRERVYADYEGAYRGSAATVPRFRERAPGLVRAATFFALFFGQLCIPGMLLGALGLIAAGAGLLLLPGIVANA